MFAKIVSACRCNTSNWPSFQITKSARSIFICNGHCARMRAMACVLLKPFCCQARELCRLRCTRPRQHSQILFLPQLRTATESRRWQFLLSFALQLINVFIHIFSTAGWMMRFSASRFFLSANTILPSFGRLTVSSLFKIFVPNVRNYLSPMLASWVSGPDAPTRRHRYPPPLRPLPVVEGHRFSCGDATRKPDLDQAVSLPSFRSRIHEDSEPIECQ